MTLKIAINGFGRIGRITGTSHPGQPSHDTAHSDLYSVPTAPTVASLT
ncbi:hypothetical protein [Roseobacter sp. MED193]|nr:hypothetical protein [Roseobacter sp. MED193]